jgi:hypothetical protein
MLTPEEVESIWKDALATAKDFLKDGVIVPKDDDKQPKPIRPEMWPGYNASCLQHERLLPHIEPGEFAHSLFRHRAPNQTDAEFNYVRNNYKQTTLSVYNDLDNSVGRAMSPGNWSLDFMETAPEFETYVTSGIREWGALEAFITHALRKPKVSDPMGVITIAPTSLDIIETEDGAFVDPDKQVKPDIIYTPCERVWGFDYDRWYLIRLTENSTLTGKKKTGIVLWLIDDTNIYRIEQYGKEYDYTFTTTVEFAHNQGQPPCIHMMGVPSVRNGSLVWQSPFVPAAEHLDIVLSNTQYLQVSVVKFMYPQPVMVGDQCEYVDTAHNSMCLNGSIIWTGEDGNELRMSCPSCKGTGRKSRLGPFNELVIMPSTGMDGTSTGINATNALAYVSPPTDSSRFVQETIDYHMLQARKVIHLEAEGAATVDAKTATEAGINRKAQQAFVKPIVLQEFRIFDFILECMAGYFGIAKEKAYTLIPPVSFDIRTPEEMLAELTVAIASGLPPAIIDYLSWQYTSAKFKGDPDALGAFDAIAKADRYVSQPWAMVTSEAASGRAQPWEVFLHYGALYIYELLASEDETFVTLEADERALKMQEKAKELATSSAPANNALGKLAELRKVV